MARFNANEVDRYGGQGGAGYFKLVNDKDVARVRFMYNGIDDLEGYAVHEVMVDGKKRYVNCLRAYNEPIDQCPFCKAKKFQVAKLFVPLYNIDEDKVQIWERGKKFFAKMSSICSRYANGNDLVAQVFEVERNGKAHETTTTYEIYPVDRPDGTTLDDLPERPQIVGGVVLDKTAEEMEYYLDNECFPSDGQPVRRRGRVDDEPDRGRRVGRRTPARDDGY